MQDVNLKVLNISMQKHSRVKLYMIYVISGLFSGKIYFLCQI